MVMKTLDIMAIPLTQMFYALVDGKNYDWLNRWQWRARKDYNTFYAVRYEQNRFTRKSKVIIMHREILGLKFGDGKITDHINGYGLDNRELNIRICNNSQNQHNSRIRVDNTSGYKGVTKARQKWAVAIRNHGILIRLGCYETKEEAARVYDEQAKKLFGEFARTNF